MIRYTSNPPPKPEPGNLRPVYPRNEGVAWWGVRQLPKWRNPDPKPEEPKT